LYSRHLHTRQYRHQRQVNGVVNVDQPAFVFDFLAQGAPEAQGYVGSFGRRACKLQIEASQRDFRERVAAVSRIQQIGKEHYVVANSGQCCFSSSKQSERRLGIVYRFGNRRVSEHLVDALGKGIVDQPRVEPGILFNRNADFYRIAALLLDIQQRKLRFVFSARLGSSWSSSGSADRQRDSALLCVLEQLLKLLLALELAVFDGAGIRSSYKILQ